MSTETQSDLRLKLVIDKKRKKILYGEADKTFIDFLFTILALPVGTMVKLLSTTAGQDTPNKLGSLESLYRSMESLSTDDFAAVHHKDSLLNPVLPATTADSQIRSLLQIKSCNLQSKTGKYYTCTKLICRSNFCAQYGVACPICGYGMDTEITYLYRDGVKLLRTSLHSSTVLNDLFLPRIDFSYY